MTGRPPSRFAAHLLAAAAVWTALVWGSRIGLMTDEERADWGNLARIGGSLLLAVVLLALAARARRTQRSGAPGILIAFAGWMVLLWVPSGLRVLAGEESTAFKVVHLGLALVSLGFGAALAGQARREWALSRAARRSTPPRRATPGTRSRS